MEREVSSLLRIVIQNRRKTGQLDLEAVEMAMRSATHQAGAAALSQLLRCEPPGAEEREIPCPCGHKARYREMRARHLLTAVGQGRQQIELLAGLEVTTCATSPNSKTANR
ncbi:MAG: hypothetical protein M3Y57_20010 [Acidobacteriota bacterium]|nr:hypothetical protein [Acidobacteriota bacterium]